mgnify:CR=1 FL=1
MSSRIEIVFERAKASLKGRLSAPGEFPAVAGAAQPFLAALLARQFPSRRIWMVCADVRAQEQFAVEMAAWLPGIRLFPELEVLAADAGLSDPETTAERLEILRELGGKGVVGPVVIHRAQWDHEVPAAASLSRAVLRLVKGDTFSFEEASTRLGAAGYERTTQVGVRGQFAIRGGIMDVFSWQAQVPVRIELDDEIVDSLRTFHFDTQVAIAECGETEILAGNLRSRLVPLRHYIGSKDILIEVRSDAEGDDPGGYQAGSFLLADADAGEDDMIFFPQPFADFGAGELVLDSLRSERFFRQLEDWRNAGWMVVLAAGSEGEIERFQELAKDHNFPGTALECLEISASRGFIFPAAKLAVLSDAELFGRSASLRQRRLTLRRERVQSTRAAMDFTEFEPGDYVVHLDHGIGKFVGLEVPPDNDEGEVLVLEYAREARLYVPLDQAWQVARYVGLGRKHPELSRLGDGRWERARLKAGQSIFDYATRMLQVQAERDSAPGAVFGPDTHWQHEFEDAFPFEETEDQIRAIKEAKSDMEGARPMDRLICGDVGFGKTEVAIRAVFKAVMGGRQAAVLAPTTVLAQQHFQTFRERMSDYPVTIELLSRFRTAAEQKKVLKGLLQGGVDVVIGTHRLISPDVYFKDLGLLVVDEEQRFGVKHKELLKEKFRQVDVLTLSATPIPRTLYLSLMGARDMSLIETPPANRQSVETIVCAYDERVFRDAILREIARGGQVYFLHNRVQSIERVGARIRELCPKARVLIGHGQMGENELEPVMRAFVAGEADVLVSTTIIESGLDIPNANTIIIDRADLFGLADLYQLRGRVGRSQAKAHAYLMLPRDLMTGSARKRVSAIKQYSDLGSGFKIAMRDLEIRGAGNLLGTAQSGHIIAVGFDLYCKLLRHAVETLKGNRTTRRHPAGLRLDFQVTDEAQWNRSPKDQAATFLPVGYISDARTRIACHRRLAAAEDQGGLENLRREWRDRFGPLPGPVENLLLTARIRIEAALRKISLVEVRDRRVRLTRKKELLQEGGRFPRLTASGPDSSLREVLTVLEKISLE